MENNMKKNMYVCIYIYIYKLNQFAVCLKLMQPLSNNSSTKKKANKSPTLNTFLLIEFIIIVSSFGKVLEMASLCL